MNTDDLIYVAGHTGLVGSAIVRELQRQGYRRIAKIEKNKVNLTCAEAVTSAFTHLTPDYVFLAAAKVGGIKANSTYPVDFLQTNLNIAQNVITNSQVFGVKKLLYLGSSCIYPRNSPQPIGENQLLAGPLEPTNQWYAIAKIAGIKLCQAYRAQYGFNAIAAMPTNLYGPGDCYDPDNCHVLPAMIRRFHEAKVSGASNVTCWGSGTVRREFLYVDDLARACVMLMNDYDDERIINVGSGSDITIKELAELVADVVGYKGEIHWDTSKPDGTPRKLLDSSRINALGWEPQQDLVGGISLAYKDFLSRGK